MSEQQEQGQQEPKEGVVDNLGEPCSEECGSKEQGDRLDEINAAIAEALRPVSEKYPELGIIYQAVLECGCGGTGFYGPFNAFALLQAGESVMKTCLDQARGIDPMLTGMYMAARMARSLERIKKCSEENGCAEEPKPEEPQAEEKAEVAP